MKRVLVGGAIVLFLWVALAVLTACAGEPDRPPHAARPTADVPQEVSVPTTTTEAPVTTTTTIAPPPPPVVTEPAPAPEPVNVDGFLACVRNRESRGDYTIHEQTGASSAAGAYQFLPTTWNTVAEHIGRADLVGIDPAAASPADQDAMAQALYDWQGTAPWGGSC